jgi:predicted MPP superfamily phosphohydrolase
VRRRDLVKLAGLSVLAPLLGISTHGAINGYRTERIEMRAGLGVRTVFASDLHLHGFSNKLAIIEESEKPDLILLGGDLYDRRTRSLNDITDTLSVVKARLVAVLGNHEHWCDYKYGKFKINDGVKAIEKGGAIVLRDEVAKIMGITIQGLDWREDFNYKDVDPNADITIVHTPDAFPFIKAKRVLAGHTHGGQICLPGGTPLYTNSHEGYFYGYYKSSDRWLFVSKGLGEMVPPRIYCERDYVVLA